MSGFSNDTAAAILDAAFGGTPFSPIATYLALTTVAIARTDDCDALTEATYTGYARLSVSSGDFGTAVSPGVKMNSSVLDFAPCTAGASTIVGVALVDSASGSGLVIASAALGIPLAVTAGVTPEFDAGALIFEMNPA
jgi:hypothetical protein